MNSCLFCKIISGEIPSVKIYEDEFTVAFLDIHPVKDGHTLFVPKAHASDLEHSSAQDLMHVFAAIQKTAPSILKAVGASAFNLHSNIGQAAGQVIFHTHFHLIPRHPDDGLRLWQHKEVTQEELKTVGKNIRLLSL